MDVKNTLEIFDLLINACEKAAAAKANDGKISAYEALEMVVSSSGDLMNAYKDADQVVAEMKDIDLEEAKQLGAKGLMLKDAIVKLVKA